MNNVSNHGHTVAARGLWHSPQTNATKICPREFALLGMNYCMNIFALEFNQIKIINVTKYAERNALSLSEKDSHPKFATDLEKTTTK